MAEPEVGSPSARVSKYLAYFDLTGNLAVCKQPGCNSRYRRNGSSTTALRRHLLNQHNIGPSTFGHSFESRKTLRPIAEFLIHHGVPLAVLACDCFKAMFTAIQQSGKDSSDGVLESAPGKDLMKSFISSMYEDEQKKVSCHLQPKRNFS